MDSAALRGTRRRRYLVYLRLEHPPALGEEKDIVVGLRREEVHEEVLFGHVRADKPLAAPPLAAERVRRQTLDVPARRERNDRALLRNEVLVAERRDACRNQLRPARVAIFLLQLRNFVGDDLQYLRRALQNKLQIFDERELFFELGLYLLALKRRQGL